jgi:outer membrane lipase/esterase
MFGTNLSFAMNKALSDAVGGDPDVELFDAFGLLSDAVAHPSDFGLSNVTDACAQFTPCDPSQYLFWDGIHPTSAAEPFISDAILSLVEGVPEPPTLVLLRRMGMRYSGQPPLPDGAGSALQPIHEVDDTLLATPI